ncbi:hypothetical protein QCA50_013394 [Cerrena zonata]|uniref:P-loop containing nucleoside triphosphate hydrolase protein n=1 Tax=Cerrena zonata TaxID=2478898 RepID=A0AAW0FPD4_9APHY
MCIPQFIIFAKGKFAMASLIALMESAASLPDNRHSSTVHTPLYRKKSRRATELRKIIPSSCTGGLELIDATFAYPSRPTMPVLTNVSVFLPAGETTFIVGGSGSGKSTIAQLLLRMYELQEGMIRLDEQDMAYLDAEWTRQHISAVSQNCILFDMTVHDNVAMGLAGPGSKRRPEDVTREEVTAVCRAALMHEFVRDLPDGYDTKLGNGGANLSGGQKQRLAIARALLRNPTVLILDEATSALDATSRLLVFEAIKAWRRNMTTVVITHDLSQITSEDFVYVLKGGALVEQGFREDLEKCSDSEFYYMANMQDASGGFLPEVSPLEEHSAPLEAILEQQEAEKDRELEAVGFNRLTLKHQSIYRPLTMGNWMLDAVADLTKPTATADIPTIGAPRQPHQTNRYFPDDVVSPKSPQDNRFSIHVDIPITPTPIAISGAANRRYSLPFTPISPTSKFSFPESTLVDEEETIEEKYGYVARRVTKRRMTDASLKKPIRAKWDEKSLAALQSVKVESSTPEENKEELSNDSQVPFWRLMKDIYPTVPHKPLILFGLFMSLASGAMTPIFSYLFSRLLYEVSTGAQNVHTINTYGGIVLSVAALDGLVYGLKYSVMEYAAMKWVTKIRKSCLKLVLSQDKKWFDKTENSSVRLMQILIKDGDDARTLIATVLSQFFVVAAMLGVGLIWAFVVGWQLTLIGIAIAPVFALAMTIQTNLVSKCEFRNKRAREDVAKGYYDAISNVRGIRAMGFESAFQEKFDKSSEEALTTGVRGAFVEGCTYGVASALIYLAEALLFYVGAVLIARGTYDYLRMIQVLNLVVFTVSIGSQLMAFTQRIAKSVQATRDFNTLLKLTTDTDESRGMLRPPVAGNVAFNHINFSYPERPDVPVLKDFSIEIGDSECVAIVGSSGSGKSTMAALLQRLYQPSSGSITIGLNDVSVADVHYLRHHISVVSQQPNLFDCTIAENIAYGNKSLPEADIRAAARAAHVHDFIMTLPKGYETHVGENASLISGGQAQRLQIARALARPAKILILDECTSALDPQNQAAVMETIMDAKAGRTTIMVTHKLPVMRMCDRILVVHEGAIVEEGTYEDLMQRRGVFAQLASGGEWMD